MRPFVVQYRTRPDQAAENQRAIEAVFEELHRAALPGVRYRVLRGADDSFLHLVQQDGEGETPLSALPAFRAFQAGVRARCVEPPRRTDVIVVGRYPDDGS